MQFIVFQNGNGPTLASTPYANKRNQGCKEQN